MKNENEVVTGDHLPAIKDLQPFSEFDKELAKLEKESNSLVFDLDDPAQEKECRSHIHSIRGIKGRLDATKKEVKADVLALGRAIDAEYNRIKGSLDGLIEHHKAGLDEREAKEQARIEAHQSVLQRLRDLSAIPATPGATFTADALVELIQELDGIDVNTLEEFQAEGEMLKEHASVVLNDFRERLVQEEADAKELEQLRKEKEEKDRLEREEQIRQAAFAEAQTKLLAAQDKAEGLINQLTGDLDNPIAASQLANRLDTVNNHCAPDKDWPRYAEILVLWEKAREILKAAYEKQVAFEDQKAKEAESQRQAEADERAKKAAADEQRRQAEAEAAEKQKRETNQKHKAYVDGEAVKALVTGGLSAPMAEKAILLISTGMIPRVKVEY